MTAALVTPLGLPSGLAWAAPVAAGPQLSFVAGTGVLGTPTAGPASASMLASPSGVAVDSAGNLYIADYFNRLVEKVTPSGTLSIIAGTGSSGIPVAGAATASPMTDPAALAVDSSGNLYVCLPGENRVVKINPAGQLSIIAGNGSQGTPTAGLATSSPLGGPAGVAVNSAGEVYIADSVSNRVLKVNTSGQLSIAAGTGASGAPTPGTATSSPLNYPIGVAVDGAGNLFIADGHNHQVEKVTTAGQLSVVAGTGAAGAPTAGPATTSSLDYPSSLAVDGTGNLYIADYNNSRIEKVNTAGTLSTLAGNGSYGPATAGPASSSRLAEPTGLAIGNGSLFFADSGNHRISKVTLPTGTLPMMTSTAPTAGTAGAVFTSTFTASGSPAAAWSVSAGALPAGLTLSSSTGVLSGTPTTAGSSTFTVRATNTAGYDEQVVTLTIAAAPSSGGGSAPVAASQSLQVSGPGSVALGAGTARVIASATAGAGAGGALTYASSNTAVATIDAEGTLTLKGAGTTTVTVTAAATTAGGVTYPAATKTITITVTAPATTTLPTGGVRLSGPDRIGTAAAVSAQVFADPEAGKSANAVIATSATFADSIAGTRLAGQVSGPLLLTGTDELDAKVATEVRRLVRKGGTVYILGQDKALSPAVQDALRSLSSEYALERLGGADRYETATKIAGEVLEQAGDNGPIYLVTGRDFADGVSVGAYAQRTGGVVILTDGDTLPKVSADYLTAHNPKGDRIVAVGGAAAKAAAGAGYTAAAQRAVVGADRFETSAKLAATFAGLKTAANPTGKVSSVGVAGGASWPDALAGGAAMAHLDGPLVLTPTGGAQLNASTSAAVKGLSGDADRAVVFGGPAAVSEAVLGQLTGLVK